MHLPTLVALAFNAWMGIGLSTFSEPVQQQIPCVVLQIPAEKKNKETELLEKLQGFIVEKYGLQGNAFCTFSEDEETSLYSSLAVSRKTSFGINGALEVMISTPEVVENFKKKYATEDHDFLELKVYRPLSTLSKKYIAQSSLDKVLIFIHERFHERISFPQRSLSEALARSVSYVVAEDFFSQEKGYEKEQKELQQQVQQQREVGEQWAHYYERLQEIYMQPNLTEERKLDLRKFYFSELQKKYPGETINNASLVWRLQYTGLLPFLDDLHTAMGSDAEKTIAFYYSLPETESVFAILQNKCREVKCREEKDIPQELW